MVCPSCGFPRPDRIADSCGYCDAYPEVRLEVTETKLPSIFSEDELNDDGLCFICGADPACKCSHCRRLICIDHLRGWCAFHAQECSRSCIAGIPFCPLCIARKKLRR
jgi:hypothetical protein